MKNMRFEKEGDRNDALTEQLQTMEKRVKILHSNFEYPDELKTQKFVLLSVGLEPVTSCVRGGQLDQTSTKVCKI